MDTTDSSTSGSNSGCGGGGISLKMFTDDECSKDSNSAEELNGIIIGAAVAAAAAGRGGGSCGDNSSTNLPGTSSEFRMKRVPRSIFHRNNSSTSRDGLSNNHTITTTTKTVVVGMQRCQSPVSSMVGNALNQLNLKRSSSAPMINQLGISPGPETGRDRLTLNTQGHSSSAGTGSSGASQISASACSTPTNCATGNREMAMELDAGSLASSFLSSLNSRPRRFSASFSPGSPGPAPSRVSQLRRQENTPEWETASEKEFHGAMNIAQSWEDLSLESMSMEIPTRRPSYTDQLWLSMPGGNSSASASASSSPAASPRVGNRFSPGVSSPSPTRKSFTSRRSLSPIAVRPSVLSIGLGSQGLKRKSDWDSNNQMDCAPQPAKRMGGLLSFTPTSSLVTNSHNSGSPIFSQCTYPVQNQNHLMVPHGGSPSSLETGTESSVSSVSGGGGDSPFFRPLDSPIGDIPSSDPSPHPSSK